VSETIPVLIYMIQILTFSDLLFSKKEQPL
jgi:hypothetical protein